MHLAAGGHNEFDISLLSLCFSGGFEFCAVWNIKGIRLIFFINNKKKLVSLIQQYSNDFPADRVFTFLLCALGKVLAMCYTGKRLNDLVNILLNDFSVNIQNLYYTYFSFGNFENNLRGY